MNKKLLLSLSIMLILSGSVMANSTIYVDEIGRLHFLGKDPGSAAARQTQLENFNNPEQKDLTNIMYKNVDVNTDNTVKEVRGAVNTYDKSIDTKLQNAKDGVNKTKGAYSYTKGAMDASNPYTYGETNIKNISEKTNNVEKNTKDKNKKRWFFQK